MESDEIERDFQEYAREIGFWVQSRRLKCLRNGQICGTTEAVLHFEVAGCRGIIIFDIGGFVMKKPVAAKAPVFVVRTLSTGGTIRIPYRVKKPVAGRPAWFQVAGPIELAKPVSRGSLTTTIKTKTEPDGGSWYLFGPLWLKSNTGTNEVVNPQFQREVKKVLAELRKQVQTDQKVR